MISLLSVFRSLMARKRSAGPTRISPSNGGTAIPSTQGKLNVTSPSWRSIWRSSGKAVFVFDAITKSSRNSNKESRIYVRKKFILQYFIFLHTRNEILATNANRVNITWHVRNLNKEEIKSIYLLCSAIVHFPFWRSNILSSTAFGVFISKHIRPCHRRWHFQELL